MPTTTKSNAARRKAPQNAQERPAAQVVQFPISMPEPRQTRPEEVNVMICECAADGVRLRLMPDPDAMCRIMNKTYGRNGWQHCYYYMNGQTFCGTAVMNPYTQTYPRKDAKAPAGNYQLKDPKDWESVGALVASLAFWGAGSDVLDLPVMTFKADQVTIEPLTKPGKKPNDPPVFVRYRPTPALIVDKKNGFLRAEDGHIIGVQLLQGERKVVWQAE